MRTADGREVFVIIEQPPGGPCRVIVEGEIGDGRVTLAVLTPNQARVWARRLLVSADRAEGKR